MTGNLDGAGGTTGGFSSFLISETEGEDKDTLEKSQAALPIEPF